MYTNDPAMDALAHDYEYDRRVSIGTCFECGEPIYKEDEHYYGQEYIDCADGMIHLECWMKYGEEIKKVAR